MISDDAAVLHRSFHHTVGAPLSGVLQSIEVNGLGDPYNPFRKIWLGNRGAVITRLRRELPLGTILVNRAVMAGPRRRGVEAHAPASHSSTSSRPAAEALARTGGAKHSYGPLLSSTIHPRSEAGPSYGAAEHWTCLRPGCSDPGTTAGGRRTKKPVSRGVGPVAQGRRPGSAAGATKTGHARDGVTGAGEGRVRLRLFPVLVDSRKMGNGRGLVSPRPDGMPRSRRRGSSWEALNRGDRLLLDGRGGGW